MKNVAVMMEDGAFALFFRPHPWGFDSPDVGRGGGGGWAQLELTDALCNGYATIVREEGDITKLFLQQEVKKVSTWSGYFSINSLQVYVPSVAGFVFKGISCLSLQK